MLLAYLTPVSLQVKKKSSSAEGVCVTTETICKAAQKKQVKTDGDRTLQLTSIDLLFKREGERVGEGDAGRGYCRMSVSGSVYLH